jgi:hypothetical protein
MNCMATYILYSISAIKILGLLWMNADNDIISSLSLSLSLWVCSFPSPPCRCEKLLFHLLTLNYTHTRYNSAEGVSATRSRCLVNQHCAWWRRLGNNNRQARELISGPCPDARTRFLSFNRTQSRVVIGLLTGHTTHRRYLQLIGLSNNPLCRRCGAEDGTSAHILCECEALASLRHAYLGSFFLDPEDINSINLGAIWIFSKGIGHPWIYMGHKGPSNYGLGEWGP